VIHPESSHLEGFLYGLHGIDLDFHN